MSSARCSGLSLDGREAGQGSLAGLCLLLEAPRAARSNHRKPGEWQSMSTGIVCDQKRVNPVEQQQLTVIAREFNDLSGVCSTEYFNHILSSGWQFGFLQQPLLKGYVTSVGGGSESVLNASRSALSSFFEQGGVEQQVSCLKELEMLFRAEKRNERVVINVMETVAFALDLVNLDTIRNDDIP